MTDVFAAGLRRVSSLGVPLAAVLVGATIVRSPSLALMACALPIVAALLVSPEVRMLVVSGGALWVFQSSSEVSSSKTVYLALFLIALTGTVAALMRRDVPLTNTPERGLILVGLLFIALATVGLVVAHAFGTAFTDSSRDVFPYLMFGAAPLFAADFAQSLSNRVLTATCLGMGVFATASFFLTWIDRRGTSLIEAERIGFSSFLLASSLVTFCAAQAVWPGPRRYAWASVSSLSFLTLLATGTRSSLVAGVGVGVALLFAPTTRRARFAGAMALTCTMLAFGLIGLKGGALQSVVNVEKTTERLSSFGSAVRDPESDQSLALREAQTQAALGLFKSAPFTGAGPGHPIEWSAPTAWTAAGLEGPSYFVDSPAGFLAKFGLTGLFVLVSSVVLIGRFIVTSRARTGPSGLALIAFLCTVAVWSVLGTPFDDKGLSIALTFLLALTIQEHKVRHEARR